MDPKGLRAIGVTSEGCAWGLEVSLFRHGRHITFTNEYVDWQSMLDVEDSRAVVNPQNIRGSNYDKECIKNDNAKNWLVV